MNAKGRIAGIDYGTKRIGIAISDPGQPTFVLIKIMNTWSLLFNAMRNEAYEHAFKV